MKLLAKSVFAITTLSFASISFAADPIVGYWKTFDDKDHKPKALVKITEEKGVITGKIVKGFTPEAKKVVKKVVIRNLKATGNNKYAGGKIFDPAKKKSYDLTATLNGNVLKLKGHLGPFSRTQVWKRK